MPQIIFELPCIIENGIKNGSVQKRYLLAVNGGGMGGGAINSNVSEIGEAEQFTFCFDDASNGEMVAKIKTCDGRFLKVKVFSNPDPQNTKPVHADAITPSIWEQFTLCLLDNGKYALRTYNGHYLTAQNASVENDPVIALVADDTEASRFTVIPQSYQNPVSLPSTKRRDYQMASTDFEETRYYIEEYIRALRGHDMQDANLPLTGGRLHIWSGPDYITGIVMEFPELGLMLGEAGVAEGEVKERVFVLGSDEIKRVKDFIGSVTVGEHAGRIVALILHTQSGQRLCEFICPAFADTEAELVATSYKIASPYGIVGLIPSFDRGERNAIKKIELLFSTETEHDAFFPFYKVEYCSDKLLNINVKDQGEIMYLAYNKEKLDCKSGSVNILGNSETQAIDGIYVYELSIAQGGTASQLYGALTTTLESTDFPEGAFLEVLGTDNVYLECELSDDHFIINEGDSIHYFADHKPEGGTFTFILGRTQATSCCFEIQYLTDRFDETAELCCVKNRWPTLISETEEVYPYFRRPLYKIAAVLREDESSLPDGGHNCQALSFSSFFGGVAYYIVATFGVSSKVAVVMAGGLVGVAIAAVVGGCIYAGIQICNHGSEDGRGKETLKNLQSKINKNREVVKRALQNYQEDSVLVPWKRSPMCRHFNSAPDRVICGLFILKKSRVAGVEYSMSKDNIASIKTGFQNFLDIISNYTNNSIKFEGKIIPISDLIDISTPIGTDYYLSYADILPYAKKHLPAEKYPYLFAVHPGKFHYAGLTMQGINFTQSFVTVSAQDGTCALDTDYICSLFVHEFIHVREAIVHILDVRFPSPDDAQGTMDKERATVYQANEDGYKNYMRYYRDILNAAVRYKSTNPQKDEYAGVFNGMWAIHPGFLDIGVYRIKGQNANSYLAADTVNKKIIESSASTSREDQYWVVRYDKDDLVRIYSFADPSLYWDVSNAQPTGNLGLYYYQGSEAYKCAQQFRIAVDGGCAKIMSTIVDSSKPQQKHAVQQDANGLRMAEEVDTDAQKWIFEEVQVKDNSREYC